MRMKNIFLSSMHVDLYLSVRYTCKTLKRNPGISLHPYGDEFEFNNGHDGYFFFFWISDRWIRILP